MRLSAREDRALVHALRDRTRLGEETLGSLLPRAERHGLAGVLAGIHGSDEDARSVARACDHDAQLAMLRRIDAALGARRAVALKGALLAERLYPEPAQRPTSDIDLLVDENAVDSVTTALEAIGYERDPVNPWFRVEHHHIYLVHPHATFIELHFHAYRGFGTVLRSEPLVARSVPYPGFENLRVLSPEDELVYLATHAAGHRFMRLGWLYDMHLLLRTFDAAQIAEAHRRAREAGVGRPLGLALEMVEELFGPSATGSASQRHGVRRRLLDAVTEEPTWPLARSATRFVYTLALCGDWHAMRSYARDAVRQRFGR